MTGKPIPALQNIDVTEKVIYLNTFSKTMTSAIRLSYMVLPPHLAEKFHNKLSFYSCTVSNLDQYVMAKFIDLGYYETHINRMRNLYRAKRDMLLSAIRKSKLSNVARIYEEDAGLHFILEVDTKCSDIEFCNRARFRGVNIRALSEYYFDAKSSADTREPLQLKSLMFQITSSLFVVKELRNGRVCSANSAVVVMTRELHLAEFRRECIVGE